VAAAYASLQEKRQWAIQYARSIRMLIEQKDGAAAYTRLQENAAGLHDYLASSSLDSLTKAVDKARAEYQKNQTQAQVTVATISNLLVQKKVDEAYATFKQKKPLLEHYLADDKLFTDLATQVSEAYKLLMERRRQAEQSLRDING